MAEWETLLFPQLSRLVVTLFVASVVGVGLTVRRMIFMLMLMPM